MHVFVLHLLLLLLPLSLAFSEILLCLEVVLHLNSEISRKLVLPTAFLLLLGHVIEVKIIFKALIFIQAVIIGVFVPSHVRQGLAPWNLRHLNVIFIIILLLLLFSLGLVTCCHGASCLLLFLLLLLRCVIKFILPVFTLLSNKELLEFLFELLFLLLAHTGSVHIGEESVLLCAWRLTLRLEQSSIFSHIKSLDCLIHSGNLSAVLDFLELLLGQGNNHIFRLQICVDNPALPVEVVQPNEDLLCHTAH